MYSGTFVAFHPERFHHFLHVGCHWKKLHPLPVCSHGLLAQSGALPESDDAPEASFTWRQGSGGRFRVEHRLEPNPLLVETHLFRPEILKGPGLEGQ